MAGGLTISTLNDSSGVLATQNGMSGICKAWVNCNGGTTPSVSASFNVSSVTYVSGSIWSVNFTTAMPDANYAITACVSQTTGNKAATIYQNNAVAPTTTACQLFYYDTVAGQSSTVPKIYVVINR